MSKKLSQFENISTNFNTFAKDRTVTFSVQFKQIFIRNGYYLFRNKKSLLGTISQGFFITLMVLALYYKIGVFPDLKQQILDCIASGEDILKCQESAIGVYTTYIANLTGLAFMVSTQLCMSSAIGVILQVPL